MFFPDEMRKLNAFVDVRVPENAVLFGRSRSSSVPSGCYSGDEPVEMATDKVTSIARGEAAALNDVRARAAAAADKQREIEENKRLADAARAAAAGAKTDSKSE